MDEGPTKRVELKMDSIADMESLLRDVLEHLKSSKKSDRRAATVKLTRISDLASTLALTLRSTS